MTMGSTKRTIEERSYQLSWYNYLANHSERKTEFGLCLGHQYKLVDWFGIRLEAIGVLLQAIENNLAHILIHF